MMNNTKNKYDYMRWGRYVVLIVLLGLGLNDNCCVRVAEASHKRTRVFESIRAVAPVSNILLPAFHFRPPQHWINDPNGPMYYNGVYHFFYQYNPQGSVWGNIVWAHSVSTDLINWQSLDPALYPSKPFDIDGCWSGSATILPGTGPAILYTGVDPHSNQVQNIALPANLSDPYLRVWVKPDYNPLVVPSPGMNASCFRDPTTAWYDRGHWKMLVGGRQHRSGVAYLYRSKDFKRWVKAKHPLHAGQNSGMWECPDFYPVSVTQTGLDTTVVRPTSNSKKAGDKYVLKVSLDRTRYDYYTVGRYDKSIDKYFPDNPSLDNLNGLRYDYGNFYASKTFYDPKKKRRILWGWANESDAKPMDVHKGWAGIQAIPRQVWLDPSRKQLLQWPIEELETLRRNPVHLKNQNVQKGHLLEVKGVTAAQADVEVVFRLPSRLDTAEKFDPKWVNAEELCGHKGSTVEGGIGPFGLATLASVGLEEYTPVFFRVFKARNNNHVVLMCSDASTSSSITSKEMYKPSFAGFVDVDLKDRKLSLRSLIDHSVVESFGARGKTCITSRVYPTTAVFEKAHLYVFNNGTSPVTVDTLDAWSMAKPAKMNQPLA